MPDYRVHVRMLVWVLIIHLFLFLFTSLLRWQDYARVVFVSSIMTLVAILILARFGGSLGGTA